MADPNNPLIAALLPLVRRVRTDVTAVKKSDGSRWTSQPLTRERLASHLNGGPPRGVCPIKAGESVTMVALLDFDSHGGETGWTEMSVTVGRVVDVLELVHGMSPVLFRSSGGRGVHLYLLWDAPQDAYSVRAFLGSVLADCGLKNGARGVVAGEVEVFPKQDRVSAGGFGNQFILPLSGASEWLVLEECSGLLESAGTPDAGVWRSSPAVPVVEKPAREVAAGERPEGAWVDALMAIPNGLDDSSSLGYDDWFRVVCGIHHETGGSAEGLELAQEWSSRSPKHDPAFLEARVWPYIKGADERGGTAVTGGTIMSLAAKGWGWTAPLSDEDFPDLGPGGGHGRSGTMGRVGSARDLAGRPLAGAGDARAAGVGAAGGGVRGGDPWGGAGRGQAMDADGAGRRDAGADGGGEDDALWESGAGGGSGDGAGAAQPPAAAVAEVGPGRLIEDDEALWAPPERRGVPSAQHLCTDLANAKRLSSTYGDRVLVAGNRWHVWDGRRWDASETGESEVTRYAASLGRLIKEEARETMRKARAAALGGTAAALAGLTEEEAEAWAEAGGEKGQGAAGGKAAELAEALEKWSVRSEMAGAIDAALRLARRMLTVDSGLMDRNPWLLNVRNGVVDLRTGELRPHDPSLLITKLADVDYLGLDYVYPDWEGAVAQIAGEGDGDARMGGAGGGFAGGPVSAFLRRWFGYCATGDISEQVFVVHWGDGSNGKSTVLGTVSAVLGDYAGTAAPQLLAASGQGPEAHPTGIADLWGKRMVTAHETKEGAVLREDFIKQATGGDKIKARYMREDFFEFDPTHKIQMLTNAKPVVRGQDHGIWRRVLLVAYTQRFGTTEQVAAGEATAVGDKHLGARLAGDAARSGVLSWIVRGAVEWARVGLRAPDAVREASAVYREEQDRVGQWVHECCEVQPADAGSRVGGAGEFAVGVSEFADSGSLEWSEPLTLGMGGLYPAYVEWCRGGGIHALSRQRFLQELLRVCKKARSQEVYEKGASGKRRKITRIFGLRMLPE